MSVDLNNLPPGFRMGQSAPNEKSYTITWVPTGTAITLPFGSYQTDLDAFVAAHYTGMTLAEFETALAAGRFNTLLRDTT